MQTSGAVSLIEQMKVVFIGATHFGLRCLKAIRALPEVNVVGVITNKKEFEISYAPEGLKNVHWANFSNYGKEENISVYCMQEKMTEAKLVNLVNQWEPDIFLVVGWYHKIPSSLRTIAPAAGLHASLLPDYSGGAPLVWAIINGEKKTGITFFLFGDKVDSGPIIAQSEEKIHFEDTIATLYARIENRGVELLRQFLPRIGRRTDFLMNQNELCRRTFPQRSPNDGEINWNLDCITLYNFIRAQTRPYPGAFTIWRNKRLIIWTAQVVRDAITISRPGEVIADVTSTSIACEKGLLLLEELEFEGRRFDGKTFRKKFLRTGERFGS